MTFSVIMKEKNKLDEIKKVHDDQERLFLNFNLIGNNRLQKSREMKKIKELHLVQKSLLFFVGLGILSLVLLIINKIHYLFIFINTGILFAYSIFLIYISIDKENFKTRKYKKILVYYAILSCCISFLMLSLINIDFITSMILICLSLAYLFFESEI